MDSFLTRHASDVKGTLSGFDRVRFRGTLRWLANLAGMGVWLSHAGVLLKEFRDYALGLTDRIKQATNDLAQKTGRPVVYLHSSSLRKEPSSGTFILYASKKGTEAIPAESLPEGGNCKGVSLSNRANT